MKNLIPILLLFLPVLSFAQNILMGISARYDDSIVEWLIFNDEEDTEGELEMRWATQNDLTKWNYDIGDNSGRIETKWRDDLSEWQVSGDDGVIITMRPRWPRDFSEWRITDNNKVIHLKTRYANVGDEWIIDSEEYGWFSIYTEYRGDPRDWIIIDEMDEDISMTMKMAMTFIAVFNSFPKD